MKQKNSSNTGTFGRGPMAAVYKTAPRFQQAINRCRQIAQKKPRKVIVGMMLFATINFVIMVYFVNKKTSSSLIPVGFKNISLFNSNKKGGAEFSIGNFVRINKLKDSLDYLMQKPQLTASDSLLFIRVCEEYSKLDPDFFNQVNKNAIINRKSHNHAKQPN